MEFVSIRGITLCHSVRRAGPARPWIVFVNSLGTDQRSWDAVAAQLAGKWNLLTYDKRGHGLSDTGEAPYAMDDHVADLDGLMGALGIASAAICGASVGGMIAQGLAARHPDKVAALILCDTGQRIGDVEFWNARIEAVRARGIAAVADGVVQRWFTNRFLAEDPAAAGFRNMLLRTSKQGYLGTLAALRDTDYTGQLANLAAPVLCIVGQEDVVTTPDQMRELSAAIAGARLQIVNGAAHQPQIERPQQLAGLIAGFLEEIGHV